MFTLSEHSTRGYCYKYMDFRSGFGIISKETLPVGACIFFQHKQKE